VSMARAAERFIEGRLEFQASWERSLAYLVVDELGFDEAFGVTARLLARI